MMGFGYTSNAFTRSSETIKEPPCSSERARGIQMKAAVPLEPPRSNRVKVLLRHLNRDALHDLLNSEHHSKCVLYPYYDAFHPREWAGLNERTLTLQKKWMRFNLSLGQSRTERTDRRIGNGCRLPPNSPHHCKCTGNAEYASTISPIDTHKEVAGKQRKIETHLRSAAPLAFAAKKGKEVLNTSLFEMQCNALLMAARCVNRVPLRKARQAGRTIWT
jgi:hypothetical protein